MLGVVLAVPSQAPRVVGRDFVEPVYPSLCPTISTPRKWRAHIRYSTPLSALSKSICHMDTLDTSSEMSMAADPRFSRITSLSPFSPSHSCL